MSLFNYQNKLENGKHKGSRKNKGEITTILMIVLQNPIMLNLYYLKKILTSVKVMTN